VPRSSFAPIADSLREEVDGFYETARTGPVGKARDATVEINSGLAEQRAELLFAALLEASGHASVADLDLLDLGCGFGALSLLCAVRGARVTGMDPKNRRLEVARRVAGAHGLAVDFSYSLAERIRADDARFDVVIANNVLCYIVEQWRRDRALAEILRVLRPGGWLAMRNPNRLHPVDAFTGLPAVHLVSDGAAERVARALGRHRSRVRLLTPRQAMRELTAAGFTQPSYRGAVSTPSVPGLHHFARYQHVTARRPPAAEQR
jgi:2-polyprenyl-3-methyl-5-hydroxy-6-metoxy-1,4-benzoquinol methylase